MKIKKLSILSLFLIIGLLFIPNAVNAVNVNIEIEGTDNIIPIIGGTPQELTIPPSDEYEIFSQEWYDEYANPVSTFEEGKEYYYRLVLKNKTAYGWDASSTLDVKNIDWTVEYGGMELSDGTLWFAGGLIPVEEFEIKVESDEGVLIGQDGPLVVPKGYGRNLHILAEEGYKITSVKVNGVEQTLPLANDELSFNNIQEDINIVVEAEIVEIEDNEGSTGEAPASKQINFIWNTDNQKFIKGTDKKLLFILDNDGGYGKVFVDGVELSEADGDYLWEFFEGIYPSIKLSEEYMKTLGLGKHTIKFVIDNVGEAETTFTILEQEDKEDNDNKDDNTENKPSNDNKDDNAENKPSNDNKDDNTENKPSNDNKDDNTENKPNNDNKNDNKGNANTSENNSKNPQTGDNIMLYIAILGISIIGIIATTIVRKKLKNN